MSHYAEKSGPPTLNPAGMRAVDQVLAIRQEISKRFSINNNERLDALTLATVITAGGGAHLLHNPEDPMSRAG
jgi:hypothetical protein